MFSAAELIEALRKRGRRTLRPDVPPGEFPPGWGQWLESMAQRVGRITGATAEAIVAVFLQRELAVPPRSKAALNRWQAFATLWRQQWQPPEHEDRRVRAAALVITFLVHMVLLIILLWLAYVRFTAPPPAAGEDVVQVEFVGEGTPQDQGGGPPNTQPAPKPAVATPVPMTKSTQPAPATATPAAQQPSPAPSPPTLKPTQAALAPPEPTPPSLAPEAASAPVAEQPLQVTERPRPDATFVLPPPTPRLVRLPPARVTTPEAPAPAPEMAPVPALPAVRPLQAPVPRVSLTTPELQAKPQPIAVRPRQETRPTLVTPAPTTQPATNTAPPQPAAQSSTPSATATTSPSSPSTPSAPAPANEAPLSQSAAAAATAPSSGTQPTAPAAGRGPAAAAKPGAWPTPRAGDDWGASTRNRPGGTPGSKPGLFNADGTPRLAGGSSAAGEGFPPGSDNWTRDQIDRAGTWLKRPPNDYTPTRFDQYWLPNETLLEQWVRRGIREVSIPVPGTSKKIKCVISLLQLGGGCAVTDPNLNDQEAIARPPPDVPFKPDLQEDQESLRKPSGP